MIGTKIIFIDPEREYKELCENLGGDWINAGGGRGGMLNPLQIRPAPVDDEDESNKLYRDEGNGMGDMALYMKSLEIFFSLYIPSLQDMQKAVLKDCLIELYNQFHIFWETDVSKLEPDAFPTFADLYTLIIQKADRKGSSVLGVDSSIFSDLAMLLKDVASGSDSFLWNGKTTLQTHTRCICLDTLDLQNTGDNVKRTQYYIAAPLIQVAAKIAVKMAMITGGSERELVKVLKSDYGGVVQLQKGAFSFREGIQLQLLVKSLRHLACVYIPYPVNGGNITALTSGLPGMCLCRPLQPVRPS